MSERFLARIENPEGVASEIDWINSRTRILGESFGTACRSIEDLIKDGSMIVVDVARVNRVRNRRGLPPLPTTGEDHHATKTETGGKR